MSDLLQVPVVALDDKREITALLTISLSGNLLPPQLIYAGKTERCHPHYEFPEDWAISHSPSHWSTEGTMIEYCDSILAPYLESARKDSGRPNQRGLLILDVFAAHRTDAVKAQFNKLNLDFVYVPAGCTGDLQPLDLAVNDEYKKLLKARFINYYAAEVQADDDGSMNEVFKLSASVLKPLHAG